MPRHRRETGYRHTCSWLLSQLNQVAECMLYMLCLLPRVHNDNDADWSRMGQAYLGCCCTSPLETEHRVLLALPRTALRT